MPPLPTAVPPRPHLQMETYLRPDTPLYPQHARSHNRRHGRTLHRIPFPCVPPPPPNIVLTPTFTKYSPLADKFDELTWIVTAFTLTSTTFIPIFGQLADVFGRHAVLQLAMFLMLVGSTLCAAAQSWGMLLLGRALQGTSSAGIMNIIMIVLADRVSLRENARNNSIFVFVGGLGYGVGPVVGGYVFL